MTSPNSHHNDKLILFSRYPQAGSTKTRLIGALGAEGAALLQKRMTEKLLKEAALLQQQKISIEVHFNGGSHKLMTNWLGGYNFVEQIDGDLGQKMEAAFQAAFAGGAAGAILVGSDIPDIDARILKQAFLAVKEGRVVIGPTHDGGYYLIGIGRQHLGHLSHFFSGIPWSTNTVFTSTLDTIQKLGFKLHLLEPLHDIDRPEDLDYYYDKGSL